jgi:hypothetical protein
MGRIMAGLGQFGHWHKAAVPAVAAAVGWRSKRNRAMQSPSRPAIFAPAPNQRRWVRDRHAAIRGRRQWVRLIRVDRSVAVMADAPYDHNSSGAWQRQSVSVWQVPCVGAEFPSLADAAAWIAAMPG